MWTAKLRSKSEVDAGGQIEIAFEIRNDGEVIYPYLSALCSPDKVEEVMQGIMRDLKAKVEAVEEIPDNLEVPLDGV